MVAAIPGPVTSALSSGCNQLIRNHTAELVTCADEIVELVLGIESAGSTLGSSTHPALSMQQRQVLLACDNTSTPTREIARRARVSDSLTAVELAQLERFGLVRRSRSGWKLTSYC
jgi:DNA processing protein